MPSEALDDALPCFVERRDKFQLRIVRGMPQVQFPRMQQHAMRAEVHAPQAIVIASTMARIANDVVRNVVKVLADLPISTRLRRYFDQRVALFGIFTEFDRNCARTQYAPIRHGWFAR